MLSSFCCLQTKKDCGEVCACNRLNEPSSQCVLGGYHPSLIKPYVSRGSAINSECLRGCMDLLFPYISLEDTNWCLSSDIVSCSRLRISFFNSSCQDALVLDLPSFFGSFICMRKEFMYLLNLNCF